MKVLAFCGSLRRVSMNAALLRVTARLAPAGMAIELFDGLGVAAAVQSRSSKRTCPLP